MNYGSDPVFVQIGDCWDWDAKDVRKPLPFDSHWDSLISTVYNHAIKIDPNTIENHDCDESNDSEIYLGQLTVRSLNKIS